MARGGIDQGRGCLILLLDYLLKIPLIESHSQLYAKMRTILIKYIWHLGCFSHLLLTAQPFALLLAPFAWLGYLCLSMPSPP